MKVFKLLSREWKAALLVMALLAAQAACELALPGYMSDMVDKGIQQSGVTSAAAERLSAQGFQDLKLFLTDAEREALEAAYRQEGDSYALTLQDGQEKAALEKMLRAPMAALLMRAAGRPRLGCCAWGRRRRTPGSACSR